MAKETKVMEMSIFKFRFYKTSDLRNNPVEVISRECEIRAVSAPAAIDIFESSIGNLRTKYTLIDIQEYDFKGNKVGEPIVLRDTYVNKRKVQ